MSKLAFKPGDVIHHECKPFIKVLRRDWKGSRCDNCFNVCAALSLCAGCMTMHYCSPACQKKDWKNGHKIECQSKAFYELQRDSAVDSMILRVFRFLAKMKTKPSLADVKHSVSFNGEEMSINDLRRAITPEEKHNELITYAWAEVLDRVLKIDEKLDFVLDDFLEASHLFRKYSFILYDELETQVVGHGLYVETYFLEHSCSPNAFFCTIGTNLSIRAIDKIQEGEQITICFTEMFSTTVERQLMLYDSYKFMCQCKRCSSKEEEIDYDKLKRMIQEFNDSMRYANTHKFGYFLTLHNEIIHLLLKLYPGGYHDTISSQHLRLFSVLKTHGHDLSARRMTHLASKIQHQVATTFGEDHSLYKLFMNEVNTLKIKL